MLASVNDGYSHVADGKFNAGFAGAGVKAGKNITLKGGQVLRPYIETSYVGRFSQDTKFNTSDYNFDGQNLIGGSVGAGLNAQLSKNWSTTAKVNTLVASDVSNEVHAYLGAEFKFKKPYQSVTFKTVRPRKRPFFVSVLRSDLKNCFANSVMSPNIWQLISSASI